MIESDDNIGTNYEQALAISLPNTKEYVDLIERQARSIEPDLDKDDYFTRFFSDIIQIDDVSEIEDNSIYMNSKLDDVSRRCLDYFEEEISSVIEDDLGISFTEPTLFLYKAVYNIFVFDLDKYFIYFINGIQNMDETFKDDIPDYEIYKYKYFKQKYGKKEDSPYQNVLDYIQYILSLNITFNNYISLALLESAGNVDLSALYIEDANYRISCDENFLFNKIKNIVLSPNINDYIVSSLINTLEVVEG